MNSAAKITFTTSSDEDGERLDRVIATKAANFSRSFAQSLIKAGNVYVDGQLARPALRVSGGATVEILVPAVEEPVELTPADIPIPIIYEDEDVIVFDKPAGIVAHPAPGHEHGTLLNAVKAIRPDLKFNSERLGLVHRLDKDTSGLIVVAKNENTRLVLLEQWQAREVVKRYIAMVHGVPDVEEGTIDAPIGRDPNNRKRMWVVPGGRPALTHFTVRERFEKAALLDIILETGRTHQIRVHLTYIGHPVVGDQTYGKRPFSLPLDRQFLHASSLRFRLPSGDPLEVETPLPPELQGVLNMLRGVTT